MKDIIPEPGVVQDEDGTTSRASPKGRPQGEVEARGDLNRPCPHPC
jgi:hypothetical protein